VTDLSALEALFFEALEKPAAARAEFLERACRGNAALRAGIARLLAAHSHAGAFLESTRAPTSDLSPQGSSPAAPDVPQTKTPELVAGAVIAGRYKLLEEIGEGGMGSVWMAQQSGPIRRLVAVKVIKAGMDSKSVMARFDAERQALALMDHPNIARVYDAGATADGRPFFVMELVKGLPITEFCDQRRLTLRERLHLIVPVCQAIQHAHQKGVIHRDIKPRNVLIAMYDDAPVPKVIDFGVAKAMSQPLTEQTLATGFGAVVGTPEYMSPEQATFNNLDIDTRSDVYSLGVLLYELLTGSPPITRETMRTIGLLEVLRVVREEEPPLPSTRLSTAETLLSLAANRSTEARKLTSLLRNELDWIVMKALEKDRRRRYESANSMALDMLRYLAGEPVQAAPPSLRYRLRKFVNRHRGRVAATAALLVALALGTGGTMWGLLSAERALTVQANQSRIAEEREASRLRLEADLAVERHAEELREVRDRDAAMASLAQAQNSLHAGDARRAGEAIEQAEKRIEEKGAEDLRIQLDRCRTELATLRLLDQIDNDIWTLMDGKALAWDAILPRWGKVFSDYGIAIDSRAGEEAAQKVNRSLISERLLASLDLWFIVDNRKPALGKLLAAIDPDEFRTQCRTMGYERTLLSWAFHGKTPPSVQPVWFAVAHGSDVNVDRAVRERLLLSAYHVKPSSFALLMTLGQLDDINDRESGPRRAAWYRAAVAANSASAHAWNNLGLALRDASDISGAAAALQEAIRLKPQLIEAQNNLGVVLRDQGDLVRSIACFREAIRLAPALALPHANLAMVLNDTGDYAGAIAASRESLRLDPNLAVAHHNLGFARAALGDYPGAMKCYNTALELNPKGSQTHNNLGNALSALGNYAQAVPHYREAIRLDPRYAEAYNNLGMTLRALRDHTGAIAAYREAIRLDPKSALIHTNLGIALGEAGRLPEAMVEHQEAIRLNPKLALAHVNLGMIHLQLKEYSQAIERAREAVRLDAKFSNAHALLGFALQQTGDVASARAALTEAARLNPRQWGPLLAKLPPIPAAPPPRASENR
jgi:serine/threonine protein kinase/Flp pilus assembly protein TadD